MGEGLLPTAVLEHLSRFVKSWYVKRFNQPITELWTPIFRRAEACFQGLLSTICAHGVGRPEPALALVHGKPKNKAAVAQVNPASEPLQEATVWRRFTSISCRPISTLLYEEIPP